MRRAAVTAPELHQTIFPPGTIQRSVVIRPGSLRIGFELRELWRSRDLLFFLIQRELKVRYKQAAIGVGWALIQPILTVAIFTLIFGHFAKMPSGGLPYVLFAFTAVLPWTYFSEAVRRGSTGLIGDADLIRRIYFPRLILPLAMTIAPLTDFLAGFLVLLGLLAWFQVPPTPYLLLLPLFLAIAVGLALAVGLWLGPLGVRYRDVTHALPFMMQVWMYASPVAYPLAIVPARWRLIYSLNPMVGVIGGFRWTLLHGDAPDARAVMISVIFIAAALVTGVFYFRRMERSFADVI